MFECIITAEQNAEEEVAQIKEYPVGLYDSQVCFILRTNLNDS